MHAWKQAVLQHERESGVKWLAERRHFNAVLAGGGGWATHHHKCGGGRRKGQRCRQHRRSRCLKWTRDARCKTSSPSPKEKRWQQVAVQYASWPAGFDAVLKQVHPTMTFSPGGKQSLMHYVSTVATSLLQAAVRTTTPPRATTQYTVDAICHAAEKALTPETYKHAQFEVTKALAKYDESRRAVVEPTTTMPRNLIATRKAAGLQFAFLDIQAIANTTSKVAIDPRAAVGLAALLEYLCAEVIELAGNSARDEATSQIEPRHVRKVLTEDPGLSVRGSAV